MSMLILAALAAATAQPAPAPAAPANPHAQHQQGMAMGGMAMEGAAKKAMDCACCKDMGKGGDHAGHAMPNAPKQN